MSTRNCLRRLAWGATFTALVSACAASGPPLKPSAMPKSVPPPPAPQPPKERLLGALRGIEPPAPVLDVLPPAAQTLLETRLKALTPEQKEQVLRGQLAQVVPLLHLKAGGSSSVALLALA